MHCKGICLRHKASCRYIYEHKRCQQCEIFIKCNGVQCPCCGYKLSLLKYKIKFRSYFFDFRLVVVFFVVLVPVLGSIPCLRSTDAT